MYKHVTVGFETTKGRKVYYAYCVIDGVEQAFAQSDVSQNNAVAALAEKLAERLQKISDVMRLP